MKKIITIIILLCLTITTFAGCQAETTNEPTTRPTIQETESTKHETIENNNTLPPETEESIQTEPPVDTSDELDFSYFEKNQGPQTMDDPIGTFPCFKSNESFWADYKYSVQYNQNYTGNKVSGTLSWEQLKDLKTDGIFAVTTMNAMFSDNNTPLMLIGFDFSSNPKTIGDAMMNGCINNFVCELETEEQIAKFFPQLTESVSETIVTNYGQPSSFEMEESGFIGIVWYQIGNRYELEIEICLMDPTTDDFPYALNITVEPLF